MVKISGSDISIITKKKHTSIFAECQTKIKKEQSDPTRELGYLIEKMPKGMFCMSKVA